MTNLNSLELIQYVIPRALQCSICIVAIHAIDLL